MVRNDDANGGLANGNLGDKVDADDYWGGVKYKMKRRPSRG